MICWSSMCVLFIIFFSFIFWFCFPVFFRLMSLHTMKTENIICYGLVTFVGVQSGNSSAIYGSALQPPDIGYYVNHAIYWWWRGSDQWLLFPALVSKRGRCGWPLVVGVSRSAPSVVLRSIMSTPRWMSVTSWFPQCTVHVTDNVCVHRGDMWRQSPVGRQFTLGSSCTLSLVLQDD